jgi:DNA repair protein RadC
MRLEHASYSPETPRDRLRLFGPQALSTSELIALIVSTGPTKEDALILAQRLLADQEGLIGLAKMNLSELSALPGVGLAKACQLQAVLELGKRLAYEAIEARPVINSPVDAANLLMPDMSLLEQEHLRVLLLDTRSRVVGAHEVYVGSLNTSLIRTGEVFREAIRRNSAAIIVAHNHPSGDPSPSPEDVAVTRAFVEAGVLLDIHVLDHLVIGRGRFVSLKERGLGFG